MLYTNDYTVVIYAVDDEHQHVLRHQADSAASRDELEQNFRARLANDQQVTEDKRPKLPAGNQTAWKPTNERISSGRRLQLFATHRATQHSWAARAADSCQPARPFSYYKTLPQLKLETFLFFPFLLCRFVHLSDCITYC